MDIDVSALKALVREKELSYDLIVETLEQALLLAYHKTEGSAQHARAELDRKTGHVTIWARVATEDGAPGREYDDTPDGFGVAVVREDGKWRCAPMSPKVLTSLSAAETELRELRSAGAVFGLLDIDDEFFLIVRPAPAGTRLLLSDATAALDYDIAAEALETLDADISAEDLEESDPFEEGDLGVLSDIGLPDAVLGVILDETDLYPDEQLGRIAREMGFAEELSAVLDRLDR